MTKLFLFVALPFGIAAAFRYGGWLGWPTLLVGGLYWLGIVCAICEEQEKKERQ